MEYQISSERFYTRLGRLVESWTSQRTTLWGGAEALCINHGAKEDDENSTYSRSAAIQLYLFGYEIPDSIVVITRSGVWFMATEKKCKLVEEPLKGKSSSFSFNTIIRTKDDAINKDHYINLLGIIRKSGHKLGSIVKSDYKGTFIPAWLAAVQQSNLEVINISPSLGNFLSVKDETELDLCRRAAVLTNKIMKHGFITEMETILDNDSSVKHSALAQKVEGIIYDPSKIGVKLPADVTNSCYFPIIQSGGKYDIKVSAESNDDILTPDVIICSLGASYKEYSANVTRTFMVDAPNKVENTYGTLVSLYDACLSQMIPGNEFKEVAAAAKTFLSTKSPALLAHLPKTLGFVTGLQFRDGTMLLNDKNTTQFVDGMILVLSVGLHNVPLSADDKKGCSKPFQKLEAFSLLISDTIRIQKEGAPEILTKLTKEFGDVSYSISDPKEDDEEGDDEDGEGREEVIDADTGEVLRRSTRSREERQASDQAAAARVAKQQELMKKKLQEARRRLSAGLSATAREGEEDEEEEAQELQTYKSTAEYPKDVLPNQVKVDVEKEALILPINGQPVAFHISTIKNVTKPEEDKATWMRVNFYIPGTAMGKDAPKNMQQLIVKHGDRYVFIKEMTFRSLNPRSLLQAFDLFQNMKKRIKQREQKAEQEKDLVVQAKLIKIKDQRAPRLIDVIMRPSFTGRGRTSGTIEAHQNGLRYVSNKQEVIDIMYANIKHAIFQPCDRTTIVLVHFHLKDFVLVGKKKQQDIQFFTEVIDASMNVDGASKALYDPDEIEEEQREREMRKRLNSVFKDFCQKVEKLASHYGFTLNFEVTLRKFGFEGNHSKEMVYIQPTQNCLVSLTETPFFLISVSDIEHAHFERITYATKNFDLVLVQKNLEVGPKTITAIPMKSMEIIQEWLNVKEVTYTAGARSMNWNDTLALVRESIASKHFYLDVDVDGEKKPAGWLFLSGEGSDEEDEGEEDDDDESFDSDEVDSDEDEEDDDDDSDEYEDSDEEDEDDDDDDDDAKDWDELEKEAEISDKQKRSREQHEGDNDRAKKTQKRR